MNQERGSSYLRVVEGIFFNNDNALIGPILSIVFVILYALLCFVALALLTIAITAWAISFAGKKIFALIYHKRPQLLVR